MYLTKANKSHKFPAFFNQHDSTKLEERLTDIETAADLTNESQAKLAKAKSRGLACTLVIEAINSEKTWDKIKELLRLNGYTTMGEGITSSLCSPV